MPAASSGSAPGAFVGVVGPSGAGKDAVMRFAQDALSGDPRFAFLRRVITRPKDGVGEDHQPVAAAAFEALLAAGGLALHWRAHDRRYGIPVAADAVVAGGGVAIANLSRTVLADMATRYSRVRVVEVTARPEILQQRLAARGRETADDIRARLARRVDAPAGIDALVIDNSGPLEIAGNRFLDLLRSLV